MIVCRYCKYEWKERVKKPKACPKCKKRFDYPGSEKKEGEKV